MCFASAVSIINTMNFILKWVFCCIAVYLKKYICRSLYNKKMGIGCKFIAKITLYNSGLWLFHYKLVKKIFI